MIPLSYHQQPKPPSSPFFSVSKHYVPSNAVAMSSLPPHRHARSTAANAYYAFWASASPARLAVLVGGNDGDVDLVGGAQQAAALLRAQVDQRQAAQAHHAGRQLQAAALRVAEGLQLRHEALLRHQEARLAHAVAQGRHFTSLAAPRHKLRWGRRKTPGN